VSLWLYPDTGLDLQRLEDGSPIDKVVYGALTVGGIWILARRRVRLSEAFGNNAWIWLFILYEGLSAVWSDVPLTSFKRWSKALGDPVMVLVLCTDPVPSRAIAATIKRCGYILIPLSLLFCKYYEAWGRKIDNFGGSTYTGVTTDKNMLGYLLFSLGLFFLASLTSISTRQRSNGIKLICSDRAIDLLLLLMIGWIAGIADSQTAMVALIVGSAVILPSNIAAIRKRFWLFAMLAVIVGAMTEAIFTISDQLFASVGRDTSLTGRTGLWETVLREPVNPLIGVGYSSFWLGERLERFWAMYRTSPPIQAHNGYIEVYVNLGLIGLCLLAGVLFTGLQKIRRRLAVCPTMSATSQDRLVAVFGIGYGIAYLFYNITEATFQGLNPLFFIFLCLAFEQSCSKKSRERLSTAVSAAQNQWRRGGRRIPQFRPGRR
jgi:O-antigen ligase